ncbi:hypothetical protein Vadar_005650 [Vaccinium darrowii]|uniref:Uncharacterized protein n=1 Tax=Vaccinium darrowii TaxID=229202 RepID=A0ACB7ZHE9_9ERIC|nr:hypothetical protein Vadar_005650 [Vaccinium darrowii]
MNNQINIGKPIAAGQANRAPTNSNTTHCFKCSEPGHRMVDCRKSERYRKGLFMDAEENNNEQPIEEQEARYDDDEIEEEFVQGNQGSLLVVRKACFTLRRAGGDDWLRNIIFQSTCTIFGKVYSVSYPNSGFNGIRDLFSGIEEEMTVSLGLQTPWVFHSCRQNSWCGTLVLIDGHQRSRRPREYKLDVMGIGGGGQRCRTVGQSGLDNGSSNGDDDEEN